MTDEKSNWPLIVGITGGIVGGIIVGVYMMSRTKCDSDDGQIQDAREIIAKCEAKIQEIEAGLETLRAQETAA
jgi:hypothetical protein